MSLSSPSQPATSSQPQRIALPETLNLEKVSKNAIRVIRKLHQSGFEAYLVGGCVRDLLIGLKPKDFDVATNARPEQVKRIFSNCRLIGRRFRLAHILFGREIIEVATFRGHHPKSNRPVSETDARLLSSHILEGRIVRDNVFGTMEEDAVRRDFTVNALFWDINKQQIIDYVNGMADIQNSCLRLIGDVSTRYREDPVRMLRAIRFSCKLGFTLEQEAEQQIYAHSELINHIPPARLFDEAFKLFQSGYGVHCFNHFLRYPLFTHMFPLVQAQLKSGQGAQVRKLLIQALYNTDQRIAIGKPVNPAFFMAVLLWYPLQAQKEALIETTHSLIEATHKAAEHILSEQNQHTSITRRFNLTIKDIWFFQWYLESPNKRSASRILQHKRFRAAYDFLQLRVQCGEIEHTQALNWWTHIQTQDDEVQQDLINGLKPNRTKRSKKKTKQKKTRVT